MPFPLPFSHCRPAQSSVGAWSAPPQQGAVGVPPAPGSSGPSGIAGANATRVGGRGVTGSQGPASYCPPEPHGLAGPSSGLPRDSGAGPGIGAFQVPAFGADDPEDAEAESVFDEDGLGEPAAAHPVSDVVPDADVAARWMALGPLSTAPFSSSASRRRLRKWAGGEASAFSFPRQDHCLFAAFESFKQSSKTSWELTSAMTSASGAAAHAVVSASAKVEALKAWLESSIPADQREYWRPFVDTLSEDVLSPLGDAASILASSFARGVSSVRKGVVAAAPPPVRPLLLAQPSSGGFFFGNPTQEISAAMNFSLMAAQLSRPTSPRRFAPSRRPPGTAAPSEASAPASSASSASAEGVASGRPARGGRGGRRK